MKIERQVNPPGPKQPYQVGFQMKAQGQSGGTDKWTVAVTCMRPAGDNGDEEDGENGNGEDEWETGGTHTGEIDIPSDPPGLVPGSPESIAANERAEDMLYQYAKDLYENFCIGYA